MHQFFLRSNCVYVIVLDGRRNSEATDAARYWLEHVRAFGDGSPVLIVGNKIDLAPVWIDIQPLSRTYAGIVGFFPVSCTKALSTRKKEFKAFRAAFEDQLIKAVTSQAMLTESQMQVIGALRERAKTEAFLSRDTYVALCRQHGIGKGHKGLDENQLLDILDTLGVIVHFKGLRALDAMLLSPEWLTKGVYTILYSQVAHDCRGWLHFADVTTALSAKSVLDQARRPLAFNRQRAQFIVEAMCRFKLAYGLPEDEDQIIIPALLITDEPKDPASICRRRGRLGSCSRDSCPSTCCSRSSSTGTAISPAGATRRATSSGGLA
ncbi:MAG TPA: COR domain-containing protein [Xanthobacteraceae bacterium]|nr:COR domain-containing protein [Xanthobacteraceae bacterium]